MTQTKFFYDNNFFRAIKKFMKSNKYKRNVENTKNNGNNEISSKHQMIRIAMSNEELPTHLIIDCSMFSYVRFSGITTLKKTIQSFEDRTEQNRQQNSFGRSCYSHREYFW
jgi:hypothetical protein